MTIENFTIDLFMMLLYLTVVSCFGLIIYSIHKGKNKYDARAIFVDKHSNEISLTKLGQLICMITSTWVIFYMTMQTKMTEGILGLYIGCWGGVSLGSQYLKSKYGYKENGKEFHKEKNDEVSEKYGKPFCKD